MNWRACLVVALSVWAACDDLDLGQAEHAGPSSESLAQAPEKAGQGQSTAVQPDYEAALDAASQRLGGVQTQTSRALRQLQVKAGNGPAILDGGQWSEKAEAIMEAADALDGEGSGELLDALKKLRESLRNSDRAAEPEAMSHRARQVAEAEQLLARIYIEVADELGATQPNPPETLEHARRRALERLVESPDPPALLKSLDDQEAPSKRLRRAIQRYEELADSGGFAPLPASFRGLRPGMEDPRLGAIRRRLAQEDPHLNPEGKIWDSDLTRALIRIRIANQLPPRNHGKKPSKRLLDKALRKALNKHDAPARLANLKKNLQRRRTSPMRDVPYKVLVNLPQYIGEVWDEQELVHRFKLIIGNTKRKSGRMLNRTPRLHSLIATIVFNPYWNVPTRIWTDEILPSAQKKAAAATPPRSVEDVLDERGFELRGSNPRRPLVRMRPGPKNALGRLKFIFENRDYIYLHDTPSKRLFLKIKRPFSHGCLRVEHPRKLAEILLTRDGTWAHALTKRPFSHVRETSIQLKSPVPIIIEYFTATVDDTGLVHWHEDVYGLDGAPLSQ